MQEELAVNSPELISRVSRPQQVSLYDHEFGTGGNGRWYPGQNSHGNKGAELKTWTAEWHKQRKGIYGADTLVKAEAKMKEAQRSPNYTRKVSKTRCGTARKGGEADG